MPPGIYPRASIQERFWSKVNKSGPFWNGTPCWEWTAGKDKDGYGRFSLKHGVGMLAHRLAYEWAKGPIPDGLQPDHLCRNPSCVNPEHLELVSVKVNVLRGVGLSAMNALKTHCPQGHPYDLFNTAVYAGSRICRECCRQKTRRRYAEGRKEVSV